MIMWAQWICFTLNCLRIASHIWFMLQMHKDYGEKKSWDCNFSFQRWTLTLQTQGQTTAPPSVHWGERSLPSSQQASRDVLNADRFCWEKPHSFSLSRCLNVFLWFIQDLVLSKAVRTADSVYTALSTGYHKVCYTVLKCEEMKRSQ